MGWSCEYCDGGRGDDHKTCNSILDAQDENERLTARVNELESALEALIAVATSGDASFGGGSTAQEAELAIEKACTALNVPR